LSDPGLEEALRVRLDFMRFTGFALGEEVPDETTLCRFRNKLIARGLEKKLLAEVNRQLERLVLKLEKAKAAVVDATIIESAARPNRVIEIVDDREEDQAEAQAQSVDAVKREHLEQTRIHESCDPDAKWLKKGKKNYFGYKAFVASDEDGFITHGHATAANKSEVRELEHLLPALRGKRVLADKGYYSEENPAKTKQAGLKSGIMYKAFKNRPLTKWQKIFNRLVSKTRYVIEQGFGTLKRKFKFVRASYMGLAKVAGQLTFKAICFNLLKALNKLKLA